MCCTSKAQSVTEPGMVAWNDVILLSHTRPPNFVLLASGEAGEAKKVQLWEFGIQEFSQEKYH